MGDNMDDFLEFDDLPDDPEIAFVRLYVKYHADFQEQIRDANDTRAASVDFMNSMLGIARGLDIDGFQEWEVPHDWDDVYSTFNQFDRALKRYVMEVKVRKSRVTKVYSVTLSNDDKERIHALVTQIRDIISKADIDERKRNSLFIKLGAFEVDVDRSRTRFENAMLMAMDLSALAEKASNGVLTPINELLRRIQSIMGKAKGEEPEQNQLPAPTEQKKLDPPPKQIGTSRRSSDFDDGIPF